MTRPSNSIIEDIDEPDFLDSIDDEDFVLILDSNGDLKTIMLPDNNIGQIPENLSQILKVLGINNHNFHSRILH